ncbi:MAG: SRPBCC domain-containing protein [Actinomycetota bacterium]|nr:SRPBCC domain-containing protein [Actinomycetota bacterium]
MIERQLVLPVPAESLWDAITDPAEVAAWFGSTVEWELRPGAPARFDGHDGSRRRGLVTEVQPGRRLSFQWWNEADGPDAASEVTYDLDPDPDGDGTRLVVTERPVDPASAGAEPVTSGPAVSLAPVSTGATRGANRGAWTDWDGRLFSAWALATSRVTAGGRP